jgi:hypothetical protein
MPVSSSGPSSTNTRLEEVRVLVERHRVRVSVYREWGPDENWRQQPVGFDVQLRGTVLGTDPCEDDGAQRAAYDALFTIAHWAFAVLDDIACVSYEFDDFNGGCILESGRVEAELAAHVLHRDDIRRPLDDDERAAVDQVRERLRSIGIRD